MASHGRGGPGRGVTTHGGGWRASTSRTPTMVYFCSGNEVLDEPWEQYQQLQRFLTPYTINLQVAGEVRQAAIQTIIR